MARTRRAAAPPAPNPVLAAADLLHRETGVEAPRQSYDFVVHLQHETSSGEGGALACGASGPGSMTKTVADFSHPAMCRACAASFAAARQAGKRFGAVLVRNPGSA